MPVLNRKISESSELLGLFPYFGPEAIGGVQSSARIAWQAVENETRGAATALGYAPGLHPDRRHSDRRIILLRSRNEAIRKVVSRAWPHPKVLVWHLSLLKLLPFLRLSHPKITLMLLGIEAWKSHKGLTRKQLDRVDLFLSISNFTWSRFAAANPGQEFKVHRTVLLGTGTPLMTPAQQSDRPVALMLSRLLESEDYKGHREVIAAWPYVLRLVPEAELWIAGDGDLRPSLEKQVRKLHLHNQVKFWGVVSEKTKQELFRQSRCLLMPSRNEGFGLVYLEAMRHGRPCLVSTFDAGREVVNPPEAGLAVDPDNRAEVVQAIVRLISDGTEWNLWSKQAQRRYDQNFTAAHFQRRLIAEVFAEDF